MTQPKLLPIISRCACGSRVYSLETGLPGVRVWCYCDWKGPWRKSLRGAILAWNRVMKPHYLLVTLRRNICDRIENAMREGQLWQQKAMLGFDEIDKIRRGE